MNMKLHDLSLSAPRLKKAARILALVGIVSLGGCSGGGGSDGGGGVTPLASSSIVSGTVGTASAAGAGASGARKAAAIADAIVTIEAHCKDPVACGQVKDDAASTEFLTIYKPLFSGTAVTNAAGAYSIPMNEPEAMTGKLANGGYFVVNVSSSNTAMSSFKVEFAAEPPATITLPETQLTEVSEQIATAGNSLTAANGRNQYVFGIVRLRDGTRKALAGRAYAAARKADGATTELEIVIPGGSEGINNGDALVGRLASFDSSNPDDARRFPGAYADTNGNTLVSLGFDFIEISDENGVNLGEKAKQASQASAAKAGGKARKAAINWSNPTVVTRYLPSGSANSLLRDSCTATYSETIADPTSNCAKLQEERQSEWEGFNMPIYTYVPSKGAWELFGIGTIVENYIGDEDSILTYAEVGLTGTPTDAAVATAYQNHAANNQVYVRIYVTNETFQNQYWNLDYPLVFEPPVEYCVQGTFKTSGGVALPGNYVSVYDNVNEIVNDIRDVTQSFNYGYGSVDKDGNYRISVVRLLDDGDMTGTLSYYDPYNHINETRQVTLGVSPNCGPQVEIKITKPEGKVTGRVVDANSNVKSGRYVWARNRDGHYVYAYSDSSGVFSFDVHPSKDYDYYLDSDYVPKGVFNVNETAAGNETSDASGVATLSDIVIANRAPYASGSMLTPSTMRVTASANAVQARASIWGYDYDGDWPLAWKITNASSTPAPVSTRARRAVAETCAGTEVASGSFTVSSYSAEAAFNLDVGNHSLCLVVKDSQNQASIVQLGAVQVMGLNENRPPVISSLTASPLLLTMTDTARTVIARASAYDLDPETTLSYTWSLNGIAQEACTATTCSVNIPASAGSHVIELIVGDGVSSTSRTVTVQVSNRAPVISAMSVSPASVEIGAIDRSVTASVTASDPDNTSLTYTWTLNGVEQACSGSSCTATLPATEGLYTFRVVVSDGDRKVERSVVATVSSTNLSIGVR
jgi:hypothetical protein